MPSELVRDHFPLGLADDGSPLVPLNPDLARARLATLEASPGYLDSIMDVKHPLHELRSEERRGLLTVIANPAPRDDTRETSVAVMAWPIR